LTDGTTSYLYDDAGTPIEQVDPAGLGLYFGHDQYGSTRLLTDATGAVAATFTYDPYGNLTAHTGTADTALRWNGQYQDADTGLYSLRARYYDPQTAQFLTVDPLAAATGTRYTYTRGNPITGTDPTGLWPTIVVGALNIGGGGKGRGHDAPYRAVPSLGDRSIRPRLVVVAHADSPDVGRRQSRYAPKDGQPAGVRAGHGAP